MSKKDSCSTCKKTVAKSAKALKCENCAEWHHVNCLGLGDVEYDFMSGRRPGFRWFCFVCDRALKDLLETANDGLEERIKDSVSALMGSALESIQSAITERLDALEAKIDSPLDPEQPTSRSFANIIKETLEKSKGEAEKKDVTINAFGQTRTITDQQVVIVRPKAGRNIDSAKLATVSETVKGALRSVPVDRVRETKSGALVVKFPSAEAKAEASNLMNVCFEDNDDFVVSQPKKMLPKMTLTGIPASYPDEEIIEGILGKNKSIDVLVKKGFCLSLVFTKTKEEGNKVAVLKMAPEIRAAVNDAGGYIYIGLSRCRAYDRFWVTQCFHCQKFSHISSKCPFKNEEPFCAFCAGRHRSATCINKLSPKCINCSSSPSADSHGHHALSQDCPLMVLQREKVIENTNFTCSKNS